MRHVQDSAEEAVRNSLRELSLTKGLMKIDTVRAVDYLDDGSPIVLELTIDRRDGSAIFDRIAPRREALPTGRTPAF